MYRTIVLFSVMAIVIISAMPTAFAGHPADSVYFEPESINGAEPYTNVVVNASVTTKSVGVDIYFDPTCVNITDVDFTDTPYNIQTGWTWWGDHIRIGAANYGGAVDPGTHLVAKLTFECKGGSCTSDIGFSGALELTDENWSRVDAIWINGTFTCTDGAQPCLGTCCNDSECTDPYAENVPCKDCIEAGKYWHPNKDTACFNDVENPPDLCLTSCPECCDGVDNADTDTDVDYPADKQCPCGLSPSEDMGGPPIPELPTLALAGIGILGAILLARKRE